MNTNAAGSHAHELPAAVSVAIDSIPGKASQADLDALAVRVAAAEAAIAALQATPDPTPIPGPEPSSDPPGVIWCPVTPDTTTDQSAAIRQWLEANAGPKLGIRPGVYRVDARMQIGKSLSLWAPGVTFQRFSETAPYSIFGFKACTDIIVDGLSIIGPIGAAAYNATIDFSRQDEHAVSLSAVKRVTLRDMTLARLYGDGVYWTRSDSLGASSIPEDITLERVDVAIAGRNGFSHIGGRRITLTDCAAWQSKLHSFDAEPNKVDDVIEDLTLTRFRSDRSDMGQTSSGPGYAVAIGAGYGAVAANGVVIDGLSLDKAGRSGRAAVYVVGPSSSKPHTNIAITGTRCDTPSTADIRNVSGLTWSDNDGLTK